MTGMAACSLLMAQEADHDPELSGTVVYRQTVQLEIHLEGDAAQFASALPRERISEKILQFNQAAALYQNHQSEGPDEPTQMAGGGTMMIRMVEPDNKVFTDLENGTQIEQREFMSRIFLIEKEGAEGKWKLTGNQREILGYACQEAVTEAEDDGEPEEGTGTQENLVHAWFTPQIAVPAGPTIYGGLPGLVLAVEMDGGNRVIEAVSVELDPVDDALLKRPRKGKKVNEEEFQAIVDEKMEEMGAEQGGDGNYAISVRIHQ